MRFRGREMAHGELGMAVLRRVQEQTAEMAKVEAHPRMEGRQMLMVLAPKMSAASAALTYIRVAKLLQPPGFVAARLLRRFPFSSNRV